MITLEDILYQSIIYIIYRIAYYSKSVCGKGVPEELYSIFYLVTIDTANPLKKGIRILTIDVISPISLPSTKEQKSYFKICSYHLFDVRGILPLLIFPQEFLSFI